MYFNTSRSVNNTRPLQVFAEIFKQNLSTGLLQCRISNTRRTDFLFHFGRLINAYEVIAEKVTRYEGNDLESILNQSVNLQAQAVDLPAHGLRMYKALVEACTEPKTNPANTEEISEIISNWQQESTPTFAKIHWENGDAIIYTPGEKSFTRQSILISPGISDSDIFPAVLRWPVATCSITTYQINTDANGWIEFYLQMAFQKTVSKLIARYKDLSGRNLQESLALEFNNFTRQQKLDINIYNGEVTDKHVFANKEEASSAYRSLINLVIQHMKAVIGASLISGIVGQIFISSESFLRQYAKKYQLVETELIPKNITLSMSR